MTMHYFGADAAVRRTPGGRQQGAASGVSSGGNALNHRPGDMPGTTYYTPGSCCVPPTVHTAFTQRAPGACLVQHPDQRAAAEAAEAAAAGASHYQAAFQVDPLHDYSVDPRVRRPTTGAAATAAMGAAELGAEQLPPTTYQAELLGRRGRSGDASYGCRGSSASAPTSPVVRPAAIGYLTTSAAAQLPIAERYAASRSAGNSPTAAATAATTGASAGAGRTSMTASAGAAACFGSRLLPGAAASGPGARPPPKDAAFLHALDQHSRGRVPGYTGHRPQHGSNVALEAAPPTRETTWGDASQQALRRPPPPPDSSRAIDSRKGLLSFFSATGPGTSAGAATGGFVSENGLAEASRYHEAIRPLEGRMRIPQASATAPRGAKFTG